MENRPYTTQEVIELFAIHGLQFSSAYYNNVILKRPTHPLYHAKLARGMWDRKLVEKFLEHRHELDGRRTRYSTKSPE